MSLMLAVNYSKPSTTKPNERDLNIKYANTSPSTERPSSPANQTGKNQGEAPTTTPNLRAEKTIQDSGTGFTEKSRPGYDDYGKELSKDARVWKTYVQEASRWDADLVDGWHRSLDLILIFAALFSAISTAFVIESIGDLQPDYTQVSAQTLSAISQTLLVIANSQPGSAVNVSIPDPDEFSAPVSAVWVNGLWFLSLSLSVAVSLIAMLAKDWVRSYVAELTGQPYQQARKRQRRWDGLKEWKVPEVIVFLPTLLHLSLLLFAVGLTIYLWNVHIGAAIPVLVVTVAALVVYVVSTVLPLRNEHCPYSTPFSKLVVMLPWPNFSEWFESRRSSSPDYESIAFTEVSYQEKDEDLFDDLTSRALSWLIVNYEDTKSVDIALQAIAGSESRLPIQPLIDCGAFSLLEQRLQNCFTLRQKTGKLYLKDNDLLEAALLYSRALNIPGEHSSDRVNFLGVVWPLPDKLVEGSSGSALAEYGKSLYYFSPNKVAFALVSIAVGSKPVHDKTGTRLVKPLEPAYMILTTRLLRSHMDDQITLEPPALLALLRAAAHWPSFDPADEDVTDYIDLMMVLFRFLLTLDGNGSTYLHALVGVALMTFACSRCDYSRWPQKLPLAQQNRTTRVAVVPRMYDSYPDTAAKDSASLITFGILEFLKNYASRLSFDELNLLIEVLLHYKPRAPTIETYDLPMTAFGSEFKYIVDSITPFLRHDGNGIYACSEGVRAVYLTVPNPLFLMDCPQAAIYLTLALQNLRTANSDLLKQRCCILLVQKSVLRSNNLANGTRSPAPLLLAFPMLESNDERIVPYVMKAIWNTTDLVLIYSRSLTLAEKTAILQPVLDDQQLSSARPVQGNALPEFTADLGYIEAWLPRLEDMANRIPHYVQESQIVHAFRTRVEGQKPPHPLWDRLIALLEKCREESEALAVPWS